MSLQRRRQMLAGMRTYVGVIFAAICCAASAATAFADPTPAPSPAAVEASPGASAAPEASASPAQYSIDIPDGWVKRPVTMNVSGAEILGMWTGPQIKTTGENVNVGVTRTLANSTLSQDVVANEKQLRTLFGDSNLTASKAMKVCAGTKDGWYFAGRMHYGSLTISVEQTLAVGNAGLFIATYSRLDGVPESADARKSILSLCAL